MKKRRNVRNREGGLQRACEILEDRTLLATITVTSMEDNTTVDGEVTLREAIQAANTDAAVDGSTAGSGDDVIEFDGSLAGQTITLDGTELTITSNITISGLGADQLTVSGDNASRVFIVDGGTAHFAHFTIADGLAQGGDGGDSEFGGGGGGGAGMGGGIFVNTGSTAIVQNMILEDNNAFGGDGGDAGTPGAGTSVDAGGHNSTGGAAGTSSFTDGAFGVGGAGGAGTTVAASAGAAGSNGNYGGGGGGGGGGGFNGTQYLSGSGSLRGAVSNNFDSGDQSLMPGLGNGRAGSTGFDGLEDEFENPIFNPDIPAGTGGGGGGGAGLGGGIFVRTGANLTVVDSHFEGNKAFGGQPGRRGDGLGVGRGGAIFAMDTVTVNQYGTTFGHGSVDANVDNTATTFPSNPGTAIQQRQGLWGTFTRTLPALTYVDGPAIPSFMGQAYLNPSVENPWFLLGNGEVFGEMDPVETFEGDTETTVSAILATLGRLGLREEVAAPTGMAIIGVDNTNGQWQYNTGEGFRDLAAASEDAALVLSETDELQFVANTDFNTVNGDHPTITFRAWDGTGAVAGDTVDTTTNGGATPYSTATADAYVNIADPIFFDDAAAAFGNEVTYFETNDTLFQKTYSTSIHPILGSREFNYTLTGVGGVWASGPSVTSIHETVNTSNGYIYGYDHVRLGTIQHASINAGTTTPGNVNQSIYNLNIRVGNFARIEESSGAIAIMRSQTARLAGATHFKVQGITDGTVYKDAGLTQAVVEGEFISYDAGNVYLYFVSDPDVSGEVSFLTIDSTADNDTGLLIDDFVTAEDTITDAITITRSNGMATHFKVTNITEGALFLDAEMTMSVSNGDFIDYGAGAVDLYFNPNGAVRRGTGSFDTEESTSDEDGGLLGGPVTTTITIQPKRIVNVLAPVVETPATESVTEGDAGTTDVTVTVTRSDPYGELPEATYGYTVSNGTTSDDDFAGGSLPSGSVTFAEGETTAEIVISMAGDVVLEANETFDVTLTGLPAMGFDLSQITTTVTVDNDDAGIVVDNLTDESDGDYTAGDVSLREAILIANQNAGADVITFDATLNGQLIPITAGRIVISDDVTITGNGVGQTTIDGQGAGQMFLVDGAHDVTFEQMRVQNGNANGSDADVGATGFNESFLGGFLFNVSGNITLDNIQVLDNLAESGGAVFDAGGTLDIRQSTFARNSSNGSGGGIYSNGSVVIDGSLFADNSASFAGGGILGGGPTAIINSTFSGNTADGAGGGIYMISGSLEVRNSTITGNAADFDDLDGALGGGIATISVNATLYNTIVAGNFNGSGTTPDDVSNSSDGVTNDQTLVLTSANNLIGDAATSGGLTDTVNNNIIGDGGAGTRDIATVLDTVRRNNGGATFSHALITGSAAVDGGDNAEAIDELDAALTTDQRGAGFDRIGHGVVDIGAVEFGSGATATLGDRVWVDTNRNGEYDPSEPGIRVEGGITVNLYSPGNDRTAGTGDDVFIATTQTNKWGQWEFTDLTPQEYFVEVIAPTNYSFTPQFVGSWKTDSNADLNGRTAPVLLAPGATDFTHDIGLLPPSRIGDRVWLDANGNGQLDVGSEFGVKNVTVQLFDTGANNQIGGGDDVLVDTTVTNKWGVYLFEFDEGGRYYVNFVRPAGYGFTSQNAVGWKKDSDANPATGNTMAFNLERGKTDKTRDAGLVNLSPPPAVDVTDGTDSGTPAIADSVFAGFTPEEDFAAAMFDDAKAEESADESGSLTDDEAATMAALDELLTLGNPLD